ncbi:MAG TPA: DUF3097 family protein [Acidimicrobiales bacterium]|jgi:hypothetical protein
MADREQGILSGLPDLDGPSRTRLSYPVVEAWPGRIVEHRASGLVGFVVRISGGVVTLRDSRSRECPVRMLPGGFIVEGQIVTLVPAPSPAAATATLAARTASGSTATPRAPARIAQASRILVEGVHDAELVEKVWGDDLRVEGIVVEPVGGIDNLREVIADFQPAPGRRLGVLVDHLVYGTKEWRAAQLLGSPVVLVTGTPFVDVWQAVKPALLGLEEWPSIPRTMSWKQGVCRAVGASDPATLWRQIVGAVRTYADLEPALVGAVEQLIDFVTGD